MAYIRPFLRSPLAATPEPPYQARANTVEHTARGKDMQPMNRHHQIAVQLKPSTFQVLKQYSKTTGRSYATVITEALELLATSTGETSQPLVKTSQPLVEASQPLIYAKLDTEDQTLWKKRVRQLREGGKSYAAISKILFQESQLSGQDGLPLSPSTIRSICSL
ncbi:MAG: hypothetical protein KDI50_06035 [Candidatus Competibacteraceae bacterium]|nr:hypothetical protein [Candidatus Competibacteraceae bacterium]